MNRIVLIGNGFDLAHGLPTKYSDFITNYLRGILNTHRQFEDENVKFSSAYNSIPIDGNPGLKELMEIIKEHDRISIEFKNSYLNSIVHEFSLSNWVDIENHYYKLLKELIDRPKAYNNPKDIVRLNDNFSLTKDLLERYLLNKVIDGYKVESCAHFESLFNQKFSFQDISNVKEYNGFPAETLFLNFNYTKTIKPYLKDIQHKTKLINIHGELKNERNPIIFGFGDEFDPEYSKIEDINSNELFQHMKSSMYPRTSNYQNLARVVEGDKFQIFVVGHSCGLSDRTMLNYIMEHENCKSIKIFYHKSEESFTNSIHEISRHFRKDKNAMRMKIVPFDKSEPCPQVQLEKIDKPS